jgi:ADP-ribosylglycohydrolase
MALLNDNQSTDRRRGAFGGLAVGDALGAAVEFQAPGTFSEVTGFRAGGPHRLKPGDWTDDSTMALALGHSIALVGWDLSDQARRYLSWRDDGVYSVTGECAVNLGDDADTTGAGCGQLAGAWLGESGIPAEWRSAQAGPDQIEPVLSGLVRWSGALS